MPFDFANFLKPKPDVDARPSLRALSEILRDPARWPAGFVWDYTDCDTCAMGMALELWPDGVAEADEVEMMRVFGMPRDIAINIFCWLEVDGTFDVVKPDHVADAIDDYLRRTSHAV